MYNCIICRYHEIATKGNNRNMFEKCLVDNIRYMVGMEALYAAQAVDLRGNVRLGKYTQVAYDTIRATIPTLKDNRHIYTDIMQAYDLIASGKLLAALESAEAAEA